jgi:quercetin dioxygenase-like cupin family protein
VLHAFKLYTGPDNASHVLEGAIAQNDRSDVVAIHFKETPPHSSFDWHDAPEPQYVITLSGTLEFTTRDGETFVLRPGDVLVATDDVGSGHKWRPIDDQPWRRAYVVLKPGARDSFVPNRQATQRGAKELARHTWRECRTLDSLDRLVGPHPDSYAFSCKE